MLQNVDRPSFLEVLALRLASDDKLLISGRNVGKLNRATWAALASEIFLVVLYYSGIPALYLYQNNKGALIPGFT